MLDSMDSELRSILNRLDTAMDATESQNEKSLLTLGVQVTSEGHPIAEDNFSLEIADCKKIISQIHQRMDDKLIHIGITGEAMCGKSTFIAALLGENALLDDPLKGIQGVNVFFEYKDVPNLAIKYADDGTRSNKILSKLIGFFKFGGLPGEKGKNFDKVEDMADCIKTILASETMSKNIKEIHLAMPNPLLQAGVSLIDLPTPSTDNMHVTSGVCDAFIILFDMRKELSDELIALAKNTSGNDGAYGCIFVGTFKDYLSIPDQYDKMRKFENKLQYYFNRPCKIGKSLFFMSATKKIEASKKPERNMYDEAEIDEFRKFNDAITALIGDMRLPFLAEKSEAITARMSKSLPQLAVRNQEMLDRQKHVIEEYIPIIRDTERWEKFRNDILDDYDKFMQQGLDNNIKTINEEQKSMQKTVSNMINSASSLDSLEKCMKRNAPQYLKSRMETIVSSIDEMLEKKMPDVIVICKNNFIEEYSKAIEPMKNLMPKKMLDDFAPVTKDVTVKSNKIDNSMTGMADAMRNTEIVQPSGGVMTGSLTGMALNFIFPDLGIGKGALAGGIIGKAVASQTAEAALSLMKQTAISTVTSSIMLAFQKLMMDMNKESERHLNAYRNMFDKFMIERIKKSEEYIECINEDILRKETSNADAEREAHRIKNDIDAIRKELRKLK